jgi:hypothetical protein
MRAVNARLEMIANYALALRTKFPDNDRIADIADHLERYSWGPLVEGDLHRMTLSSGERLELAKEGEGVLIRSYSPACPKDGEVEVTLLPTHVTWLIATLEGLR